jgi:hypothetical protein
MKINGKCNVCTTVMNIYGTVESVVPWLCECGKKSAQSSLSVRHHRKVRIMDDPLPFRLLQPARRL